MTKSSQAQRQVAEQVDRSLESYMEAKDIQASWPVRERIAVCVSSNPKAQYLIARASRMARRMDGELYVIYVDIGVDKSERDQKSLAANLQFAENLGAKVVRLKGKTVAEADFPAITQALGNLGVPYTVFDMNASPGLSPGQLSSGCHGFYQGVILANGGYIYSLIGALNLAAYEHDFGIRQVNWFTFPGSDFGLQPFTSGGDTTPPNQLSVTYTSAGQSIFSYANPANPLTISFAFAYLAQPLNDGNTTPLLVDASGNALAVLHTQFDGRQYLTHRPVELACVIGQFCGSEALRINHFQ